VVVRTSDRLQPTLNISAQLMGSFRDEIDRQIDAASAVVVMSNADSQRRLDEAVASHGLAAPTVYHARFLPTDRARIEAYLETIAGKDAQPTDRRGRIVVATQVAEQSLDLDFDAVVTDLAPIDVLIQRIGRCRRHARDVDGNLLTTGTDARPPLPILILAPSLDVKSARWFASLLPGAAAIYGDDARLWLGLKHLLEPDTIPNRTRLGPIVFDDDLKPLIESVYAEDSSVEARVPPALLDRLRGAAGTELAHRDQGRENRLGFREGLLADMSSGAGRLCQSKGRLNGLKPRKYDVPIHCGQMKQTTLRNGWRPLFGRGGISVGWILLLAFL
jgi:hypothetical protein